MRQVLLTALLSVPVAAMAAPDGDTRPNARPAVGIIATAQSLPATRLDTAALDRSLRPRIRPGLTATPVMAAPPPAAAPHNPAFDRWVDGFRTRARAAGIEASTLDRAFAGAAYLPKVIERDRNQTEFTLSIGDYLGRAASDTRVANGRDAATQRAAILRAVETRFGVEARYVAAVWGMESNYGTNRGDTHIVSALATLAHEGRRGAFFEEQLIAALRILQNGDTDPENMTGSWAGAMGHTQFIPTSYESFAVDFTGDGRRDIWSDDPTDALASTAAYLAKHGWITGQPWGVEVVLPDGFDFTRAADSMMPSDWARLGIRDVQGRPVPDHGTAKLLLPGGAQGVAFLTFKNFDVIKRYNNSDAYALGVGHLGDRIGGAGPFAGRWPEGERSLKRAERQELQSLLTARGYSTGGVDGMIGPNTVKAIRAFQIAAGLDADGHPSVHLLTRLRR